MRKWRFPAWATTTIQCLAAARLVSRSDPILSAIRTKKDGEVRIPVPKGTRGQFLPHHPDWITIRTNWNSIKRFLHPPAFAGRPNRRHRNGLARTGKPIAGVEIKHNACILPAPSGGWGEAITDKQGKFTIGGPEPDRYNVLMMEHFSDPTLTAAAVAGVTVKTDSATRADLHVIKGRLLTGRVIDGQTGKAVTKCPVGYYGGARPRPGAACMMENTDVDGKFHFYVPAGASYVYIADGQFTGNAASSRDIDIAPDKDPEPLVLTRGPKSRIDEQP